jgi:hypothetical protein
MHIVSLVRRKANWVRARPGEESVAQTALPRSCLLHGCPMPQQLPTCVCGTCRLCVVREKNRDWRRRNREKVREKNRRWAKTSAGRQAHRQRQKAYRDRHPGLAYQQTKRGYLSSPEKARARAAVHYAVRCGKLTRMPCEVCGNPNSQAHHDDYSKPLEVKWFCPVHHAEHEQRGVAISGASLCQ